MKITGSLWNRKMTACVLAVILGSLLLSGCKKEESGTKASDAAQETTLDNGNAQLVNPMAEAKDSNAFETIGVHMIAPGDAEDVKCFIINNEVADMQFTLEDVAYTCRASDTAEDFAGIFERFKEGAITLDYEDGSQKAQAEIKTTESGGRLAAWSWGSTRYTLYTAYAVPDDGIKNVTMKLMELSQNEK